jgi:hypothetical protein
MKMINILHKLVDGWNCFRSEVRSVRNERNEEQWAEWKDIEENLNNMKREESKWEKEEDGKEKVEKPGYVLTVLRYVFGYLFLLSLSKWLSQTEKKLEKIKDNDLSPYKCVDVYVTVWLAVELIMAIVIYFHDSLVISKHLGLSCFFLGIFSYRLFDIFQSWVSQFVLRYRWNAINANRSLVLAFVGYLEVTIIGTIIRMIFEKKSSLYNSVVSLIANPQISDSSPIQYVEIMFSILFLTVVAQQIIGRISNKKDEK